MHIICFCPNDNGCTNPYKKLYFYIFSIFQMTIATAIRVKMAQLVICFKTVIHAPVPMGT